MSGISGAGPMAGSAYNHPGDGAVSTIHQFSRDCNRSRTQAGRTPAGSTRFPQQTVGDLGGEGGRGWGGPADSLGLEGSIADVCVCVGVALV